jgi:hypothetical protein
MNDPRFLLRRDQVPNPMPRRAAAALPILVALLAACGTAAPVAAPAPTTAALPAEEARVHVFALAHDSMRGRDTGSPEIRQAAEYLAARAAGYGALPAGEGGSFYQSVPLIRTLSRAAVSAGRAGQQLEVALDDVLPITGLFGLPAGPRPSAEGPIVYAGYLNDGGLDPARELRPEQLVGAVVVIRMGPPPGVQPGPRPVLAPLLGPGSRAAAVLLVADGPLAEYWDYADQLAREGSIQLAADAGDVGMESPAFFFVRPGALEGLAGRPLEGVRNPALLDARFQYRMDTRRLPVEGFNVVALIPGSDPARAGQLIALGAHYDHVGVGPVVAGDSIYNGADDNASGTAALLLVARYLGALPQARRPARSVLFVWFTAEEKGLLGSEHFTDHPTVERASIVAHVNMDMVGRNHPDSIFVVGSRRLSTEYGDTVEAVNRRMPRPFALDYSYDAPGHPEMIYCRSDHWNFARYGIPILFLTTGLHPDYHQPSDIPERIDFEKVARVATLTRNLVYAVGNMPAPPRVDRPVPPPGAPCS